MRRLLPVLALLGVLLPAASAHASGDLERPSLPGALSDERTLTRWTTALRRAPARVAADPASRVVGRLRYYTEDRLPEVYLGLEQAVGADGKHWVRVRLPMRPNGRTGWVPRAALNGWRATRDQLRVSLRSQTATLHRRGRRVWRARVGVGAPGTPTPSGRFYIRERIPNLAGSPVYGPVAFGTSAYSRLSDWPGGGVIGIHGTNEPQRIPGRVSHGCIRVANPDIRRLARLLEVGTPVHVTR